MSLRRARGAHRQATSRRSSSGRTRCSPRRGVVPGLRATRPWTSTKKYAVDGEVEQVAYVSIERGLFQELAAAASLTKVFALLDAALREYTDLVGAHRRGRLGSPK